LRKNLDDRHRDFRERRHRGLQGGSGQHEHEIKLNPQVFSSKICFEKDKYGKGGASLKRKKVKEREGGGEKSKPPRVAGDPG